MGIAEDNTCKLYKELKKVFPDQNEIVYSDLKIGLQYIAKALTVIAKYKKHSVLNLPFLLATIVGILVSYADKPEQFNNEKLGIK